MDTVKRINAFINNHDLTKYTVAYILGLHQSSLSRVIKSDESDISFPVKRLLSLYETHTDIIPVQHSFDDLDELLSVFFPDQSKRNKVILVIFDIHPFTLRKWRKNKVRLSAPHATLVDTYYKLFSDKNKKMRTKRNLIDDIYKSSLLLTN